MNDDKVKEKQQEFFDNLVRQSHGYMHHFTMREYCKVVVKAVAAYASSREPKTKEELEAILYAFGREMFAVVKTCESVTDGVPDLRPELKTV
jgi:hypothetical protein